MNVLCRDAGERLLNGIAFALPLYLTAVSSLFAADELDTIASPFVRDSKLKLQLRTFYLARNTTAAADSLSWADGGWLEYRSGWLFDALQLGLTGYTAQKLSGPASKDGASLLATGQKPYSVVGESFAALKHEQNVLTAGRFLVNQFEVNSQDTRMSPRTFQGVSFNGKAGIVDYYAGRITRMKALNTADFIDVATAVGAPASVNEPLLLLSAHIVPNENLAFGLSGYRLQNVLTSTYADATGTWAIDAGNQLRLSGQYMQQDSAGANLLTGSTFATDSAGLKLDWLHGPLILSGMVMSTGRGAAYRTPFGSWQGYACRIIANFDRAGEQVQGIDAAFDFGKMGAPGLSLFGNATSGRSAINSTTGGALSNNTEYNFTIDYRLTSSIWPKWAHPLWLRARTARLDQQLGSVATSMTEHHFVLNYAMTLN